jgi:hypothetical protein
VVCLSESSITVTFTSTVSPFNWLIRKRKQPLVQTENHTTHVVRKARHIIRGKSVYPNIFLCIMFRTL